MVRTSYLNDVYHVARFKRVVKKAVAEIKLLKRKLKFDSIAFTGHSGAALAYAVSAQTGIPLTCVRKKGASSHFSKNHQVEGHISKKYLIVDDFIDTGATIDSIIDALAKECWAFDIAPKFVGIYAYSSRQFESRYVRSYKEIPIFRCLVSHPHNSK